MRRAFAGVDLARLDPFVHMDQMGEVDYAPRRAQGHPVAPPSRFRDGHLHDRRDLPAPGLGRRRWCHHQRGHPVDDGGRRDPAHRGTTGGALVERRPVPRDPALGQPAGRRQVGPAPLSGHPHWRGGAGGVARRRGAGAGHRRPARRPRRPRVDPHPDGHGARHGDRRARWCCPGRRNSTPSSTSWPAGAASEPRRGRWGRGPGRLRRRGHLVTADARQDADTDLEVLVLGGEPSENRWPPTGPSS